MSETIYDENPYRSWPVLSIDAAGTRPRVTGPPSARFGSYRAGSDPVRDDPFSAWHWDGNELSVTMDRYGFAGMFYYADASRIVISPALSALLDAGIPRDLDYTALGVLFRLGFMVGQDTPFLHIKSMPAGGTLTWSPGAAPRLESRYLFAVTSSLGRRAAVDEYIDRFRESISRRPSVGSTVVPLSGGRDSRHIFLELISSGRTVDRAVSVASWEGVHSADAKTAKELSARAGVHHEVLSLPSSQWKARLETSRATHFCTLEHWWLQPLARYLKCFPGDVTVYEGVGGDVLSTAFLRTPTQHQLYSAGKYSELAEHILADEGYLPYALLDGDYMKMPRDATVARVADELALHKDAPNPLGSFYVYNRTRRVTSIPPCNLLASRATVWTPYLDSDLWDFLTSLPAAITEDETRASFHDEAISRAYPTFSDIPYARKRTGRPSLNFHHAKALREMAFGIADGRTPINKAFMWSRALRGMVDPHYAAGSAGLMSLASYFTALAKYTRPNAVDAATLF